MHRLEYSDRCFRKPVGKCAEGKASDPKLFFIKSSTLIRGNYVVRVQLQYLGPMSEFMVRLYVRSAGQNTPLLEQWLQGSSDISVDLDKPVDLDKIDLQFELLDTTLIEFCGEAFDHERRYLLRNLTIVRRETGKDVVSFPDQYAIYPELIVPKTVIFGTTSVCNASCLHCPVNKDAISHFTQGTMSLQLYTRIISELSELEFSGSIMFGLFGDPLFDPFIVQRCSIIKEILPSASIHISTNCGLFHESRHKKLAELCDNITIHVESLDSEIYDKFMAPLTTEKVFPKIRQLLRLKRNNIRIVTPVHQANLENANHLKQYWEALGADETDFQPVGNRSLLNGIYDDITLAPTAGCCRPSLLMEEFVIDWDGRVLTCCFDFTKRGIIGDLKSETVQQALHNQSRQAVFAVFDQRRWSDLPACNSCRYDDNREVTRMLRERFEAVNPTHLPVASFRSIPQVDRSQDGRWQVTDVCSDGVVIFGPYRRLEPGQYQLTLHIDITSHNDWFGLNPIQKMVRRLFLGALYVCKINVQQKFMVVEVTRNHGNKTLASLHCALKKSEHFSWELNFDMDIEDEVEFRIFKQAVEFTFSGVTLRKQNPTSPHSTSVTAETFRSPLRLHQHRPLGQPNLQWP